MWSLCERRSLSLSLSLCDNSIRGDKWISLQSRGKRPEKKEKKKERKKYAQLDVGTNIVQRISNEVEIPILEYRSPCGLYSLSSGRLPVSEYLSLSLVCAR